MLLLRLMDYFIIPEEYIFTADGQHCVRVQDWRRVGRKKSDMQQIHPDIGRDVPRVASARPYRRRTG